MASMNERLICDLEKADLMTSDQTEQPQWR